jgi:hypothetical protein
MFDGSGFAAWINSIRSTWAIWGLDAYILAVAVLALVGVVALMIRDRLHDSD